MEANCPQCQKVFKISKERLKKYDQQVKFNCPACNQGLIKIDLDSKPGQQNSAKSSKVNRQPAPSSSAPAAAQPPRGAALKRIILRKMEDLPAMPQIVIRAREIMADPNAGINDLVVLFEKDQSIVTNVLRLGNSAYYGVSGRIATVNASGWFDEPRGIGAGSPPQRCPGPHAP